VEDAIIEEINSSSCVINDKCFRWAV
jgi:hypothetical protein